MPETVGAFPQCCGKTCKALWDVWDFGFVGCGMVFEEQWGSVGSAAVGYMWEDKLGVSVTRVNTNPHPRHAQHFFLFLNWLGALDSVFIAPVSRELELHLRADDALLLSRQMFLIS